MATPKKAIKSSFQFSLLILLFHLQTAASTATEAEALLKHFTGSRFRAKAFRIRHSETSSHRFIKLVSSSWHSRLYGTRIGIHYEGDSFGVVALEVMMGRHPGDLISALPNDSDMLLMDVIDQRLPPPTGKTAEEVMFAVSIALGCIQTNPKLRPDMRLVAQELSAHEQTYISGPLGSIKMSKLADFWNQR